MPNGPASRTSRSAISAPSESQDFRVGASISVGIFWRLVGIRMRRFCESEKFKRQIDVMGLADLCLAAERQIGKPAAAEQETVSCQATAQNSSKRCGRPSMRS